MQKIFILFLTVLFTVGCLNAQRDRNVDSNTDGKTDLADFVKFTSSFGKETPVTGTGLEQFEAALTQELWESEDLDWVNWVVNNSCATRIHYEMWSDAQRQQHIDEYDIDVVDFWSGASMNRGDYMRQRGVGVLLGSDYEYQEAIGPMFNHGPFHFEDNEPAIKENGTVALRWPWKAWYMDPLAPKWGEVVSQGVVRHVDYADGVFQDNVGVAINGNGGGNYGIQANKKFIKYLKNRFTAQQIAQMGLNNLDNFSIREYVVAKRAGGMDNSRMQTEPVIHEFIRFQYIEHMLRWIETVEQARKLAAQQDNPIPVLHPQLPGGWGPRVQGMSVSPYADVSGMETSSLIQRCFIDNISGETRLPYKVGLASGNFKRPIFNKPYPIGKMGEEKRLPSAVVLSEGHANGGVPMYTTFGGQPLENSDPLDPGAAALDANRHHSAFVGKYRTLFTDRKPVADVALLLSLPSVMWRNCASIQTDMKHNESMNIVSRLLSDNHIPFDIVMAGHPDVYDDTENLKRLEGYSTVILPDADCLSNKHIKALVDVVSRGDKLILWGTVATKDEEMANRRSPAFDTLKNKKPQQVVSISSGLADSYKNGDISAGQQILTLMDIPNPLIQVDAPETLWFNIWRYGGGAMKSVQMVNYDINTEGTDFSPVSSFTLKLRKFDEDDFDTAKFYYADHLTPAAAPPEPVDLQLSSEGDYWKVTVPAFDIFGVVALGNSGEIETRFAASELRKRYERLKIALRCKGANSEGYINNLKTAKGLLLQIQGKQFQSSMVSKIPQINSLADGLASNLSSLTGDITSTLAIHRDQIYSISAYMMFDFGASSTIPGWYAVDVSTNYTPSRKYGWTQINRAVSKERNKPNWVWRNFIRSQNPVEYATDYPGNNAFPYPNPETNPGKFRVDLPNGEYIVTVLSGDYTEIPSANGVANEGRAGNTYVRVNGEMVLCGDRLFSGYYQQKAFKTSVTNGFLELEFYGDNTGPLYHNSIEWLVNGLIIQRVNQEPTSLAKATMEKSELVGQAAVRNWLVVGPFDDDGCTGIDEVFGPEQNYQPSQSYTGKNGIITWQEIPTLTGSYPYIDFAGITGDIDEVAAFALTFVYCPENMEAEVIASTTQRGQIFLNGELVIEDRLSNGLVFAECSNKLQFNQGWNTIMIKSVHYWSTDWSAQLSLISKDGKPLKDIDGVIIKADK
jgi:hypothetical protein